MSQIGQTLNLGQEGQIGYKYNQLVLVSWRLSCGVQLGQGYLEQPEHLCARQLYLINLGFGYMK